MKDLTNISTLSRTDWLDMPLAEMAFENALRAERNHFLTYDYERVIQDKWALAKWAQQGGN
jgi:hypothetical protein